MSGLHLATVSTALWLVATVALFILLAGWSTGSSWGLSASLVRGMRGWADRNGGPGWARSPSADSLRPILDPYAFVRRDGRDATGSRVASARADAAPGPSAEIIDLGERHLSG